MGQTEGLKTYIPMQRRIPSYEDIQPEIVSMYRALLELMNSELIRNGRYHYAEVFSSAEGSEDHQSLVGFFYGLDRQTASTSTKVGVDKSSKSAVLILVNYCSNWSNGWVKFPEFIISHSFLKRAGMKPPLLAQENYLDTDKTRVLLRECFSPRNESYERKNVVKNGVWFNLAPWQSCVFELCLI
eukprot:GHVN01069951.1.p1 GENE.GHVN01069951.1~~GHVN01069951.1.p1  ORF type:complete len:185 (+),score=11.30 GHVN01069951.1:3-557(+)